MVDLECVYNPKVDISPVSQSGTVNLCQAYANGHIPSNADIGDMVYNDVDDPRSLLGRPADVFEEMQQKVSVHNYKKSKAGKSEPSVETTE